MKEKKKEFKREQIVKNTKVKDNGAKLIFSDPVLCADFLRGYTDIEMLKNVQPEDIEDISERFLPMWQEGRDSDSVKRISLGNGVSLFVIAIIEHQSKVYYDMSFKLLRYMVMVLTDYEQEQERLNPGSTKRKEFKYPPIIPIVYYEGTETWSAVKNFGERVYFNDTLGKYIPSFDYEVVSLSSYSQNELIQKKDVLSLIMLINQLRSSEDFKRLKDIPEEYFEHLEQNTPEYLLQLISKIIAVFLYRINVPRKEVEAFTDQVERREFTMLFDSFEAYDVQETRRVSKAEGKAEVVGIIRRKLQKKMQPEEIADLLELDTAYVEKLAELIRKHGEKNDAEIAILYLEEEAIQDKEAEEEQEQE